MENTRSGCCDNSRSVSYCSVVYAPPESQYYDWLQNAWFAYSGFLM